jgi:hypothetical protein
MQHLMVCAFLLIFTVAALHPAVSNGQTPLATDPYSPLLVADKAKVFGHRIVAPTSLAKSAVTAGINQWQNSPAEWGQGLAGYGRRYGHKVGTRAIENGIGFVTAAAMHEDPRYFRSAEGSFWGRVQYALKNTVMTRKDSGQQTIAVWRISGNYGAQFVSNAWRPDRYTQVSDTLGRGTVSIGYDAASNLLKEFWPDIRKRIFRR